MRTLRAKAAYKIRMMKNYALYSAARVIAPMVKSWETYRNLWIISERGKDAGDNGLYLFRYIRKVNPDLNIRYIIADDSPDADKVRQSGRTIRFGSMEHYLAIVLSKVKISTHLLGYTPLDYLFSLLEKKGQIPGKRIFLQHGVTKDSPRALFFESSRPDLFVCAARPEADFIEKNFGHPQGVVKLLGFCRYDGLPLCAEEKTGRRSVLVMPTWRLAESDYSPAKFKESDYYRQWAGLLLSDGLKKLLCDYDYDLYFYPHYKMQQFLSAFPKGTDRIHIASRFEYEVQDLLIRTDLLITDFSSVLFDYVYMGKPAIYYQPGEGDRPGYHFEAGWFSYERDGFGPVTGSLEETVREIEKVMKRGGVIEEKYLERGRGIFMYHDHENCRRNYEEIMKLACDEV